MPSLSRTILIVTAAAVWTACSGGSDSAPQQLANEAPIARIAVAESVLIGADVVADGGASSDPEGAPLSFSWELSVPVGSTCGLSAASGAQVSFTPDLLGLYQLSLVVNDGVTDSAAVTPSVIATQSVCVSSRVFDDVTAACGLHTILPSLTVTGSGIACGDFDGDGDQDIVFAERDGMPYRYFRNDGAMQFSDQTATANLGSSVVSHGFAAADVDRDGDLDLFAVEWQAAGKLFINDGMGSFTEQAQQRGIVHVTHNFSANFGDYDRDGWIDLYLGNRNEGEANILYRNTGGGQFLDVTVISGVGGFGATYASAFMDYNEDGWPDIVEVNDWGTSVYPNEIYENLGNGAFAKAAIQIGASIGIDGMGVDYADVFNDGGVDWYATDTPSDHLFMHWDAATQRYRNDTWTYSLQGGPIGWACNFFDYDNDGWQDLHVVHMDGPNHVYRNPAREADALEPWTEVGATVGLAANYRQFTALVVDLDDDGHLDIVNRYQDHSSSVTPPDGISVHHNQPGDGHWLKIATRGTSSNLDGIGARVVVETGDLVQRQWVRSGVGYVASSDMRLHFGLGCATQVDRVTITWPLGQVQYLDNVAADQILEVVEPSFVLRSPATVSGSTALDLHVPGDEQLAYLMVMSGTATPHTVLANGKVLPLALDALSAVTSVPGNAILPQSIGQLDSEGRASSSLHIPAVPALIGTTFLATAVTMDGPSSLAFRTVFPRALEITIQ
jgi:hypothetical protein